MSKYETYSPDQLEELFSNYLIDSWSYSKVQTFARNEKAFEMIYLYNCFEKASAANIAGRAYHEGLCHYFAKLQTNKDSDLIELQQVAYDYIDAVPSSEWKIQKTTPTVEDCIAKATKESSVLLANFMKERAKYDIKEVLGTEIKLKAWLTVNGVDVPLPCNLIIDLVAISNEGKRILIDHKSKRSFTDEKDAKFTNGKQAITYVLGYEASTGKKVDEVWFIENKVSKNKDNSDQLVTHKYVMDEDTRRLYESLLYEPLRRMLEAVGDPDYVYMINDSDTLTDKAELYDFWAKTMIAEVEDFDIPENKKEVIKNRLRKIRDVSLANITPTTIKNFKAFTESFIPYDFSNKNMTEQEKIEHILRSFGIVARVQHTFNGYSSSSYLLELNAGTQISAINRYRLDIANALNVPNVRIQKDLFVFEGKSYLAVESGKRSSAILAWDQAKLIDHKIPLGLDNFGQTVFWDLNNPSTPHALVGGATGSGKSVCIKSTIAYAQILGIPLYIFDPKFEFTGYSKHPNVTVINDIERIEESMKNLVDEMQERVVRDVSKITMVIFDEFADAVANSRKGKELDIIEEVQDGYYAPKKLSGMFGDTMSAPIPKMKMKVVGKLNSLEENLRILLQKGRSSGFRIMAATQRASVKVITGDAKVNFPVQLCFRVPKEIDSQVMIDESGAESLNGRGDCLIKSPEYMNTIRFQAFYKE